MPAAENVPSTTLVLGGQARTLAFTLGAARRFKQATGKRLDEIDASVLDPFGYLTELVWAMLDPAETPRLTADQVGELLHPRNLEAVGEAVKAVLVDSVPEPADPLPETPATSPPPADISPTSTISGPLAASTSDSQTPSSGA